MYRYDAVRTSSLDEIEKMLLGMLDGGGGGGGGGGGSGSGGGEMVGGGGGGGGGEVELAMSALVELAVGGCTS